MQVKKKTDVEAADWCVTSLLLVSLPQVNSDDEKSPPEKRERTRGECFRQESASACR